MWNFLLALFHMSHIVRTVSLAPLWELFHLLCYQWVLAQLFYTLENAPYLRNPHNVHCPELDLTILSCILCSDAGWARYCHDQNLDHSSGSSVRDSLENTPVSSLIDFLFYLYIVQAGAVPLTSFEIRYQSSNSFLSWRKTVMGNEINLRSPRLICWDVIECNIFRLHAVTAAKTRGVTRIFTGRRQPGYLRPRKMFNRKPHPLIIVEAHANGSNSYLRNTCSSLFFINKTVIELIFCL